MTKKLSNTVACTTKKQQQEIAIRYESIYLQKNELDDRKTVYLARDLKEKLMEIVMAMRNKDVTLGMYIENILQEHIEANKESINTLVEIKCKRVL